jgi:predicted DNA-binding protein
MALQKIKRKRLPMMERNTETLTVRLSMRLRKRLDTARLKAGMSAGEFFRALVTAYVDETEQ